MIPQTMESKNTENTMIAPATASEEAEIDKSPAVEVAREDTVSVCGLCHQGHVKHPLESGKLFSILGNTVHYFCMLFTAYR